MRILIMINDSEVSRMADSGDAGARRGAALTPAEIRALPSEAFPGGPREESEAFGKKTNGVSTTGDQNHHSCSGPMSVDPICPQPRRAPSASRASRPATSSGACPAV